MAYFARIENGAVVEVIRIANTDAPDPAPANSEPLGQTFIANTLGLSGEWRQTSYNGTFRKQYAGEGFTYDAGADVFIAPKPFVSWTLDANHDWQPPTPYPTDAGPFDYVWDEDALSWVEVS